ncbi:MAG: iron-containing alcohol dehydrogenase [Bacteroidales bacterium]|nr:iron-containing alcohol dehydrogenase [Bacteroidales bacterium]
MENFTYYNPTVLHFGRGVLDKLPSTLLPYGKKVLLVYGKGSIRKNGVYDKVIALLETAGLEITEYSGIKSNPLVEDVDAAASLGREKEVDVILAIGGGSVIDSAKIISITIPVNHTAWNFYTYRAKPQKSVPLVAVLTLAATGTEMNPFAVLQNEKTGRKDGYRSDLIFPRHSFLDPELTYSVPLNYTAYGISDLIAHCLENYFGQGECSLTDRFIFSIINDAMDWGPKLINNLGGYEERAAIMYDATMALNLLTANGKSGGDWGVHALGHMLSLLHDVPHGASLSIIYPAWMRHFNEQAGERIGKLGVNLFGVSDIPETIEKLESFFRQIGSPVRLSEVGIGADKFEEIIQYWTRNKAEGSLYKFNAGDYSKLIKLMA